MAVTVKIVYRMSQVLQPKTINKRFRGSLSVSFPCLNTIPANHSFCMQMKNLSSSAGSKIELVSQSRSMRLMFPTYSTNYSLPTFAWLQMVNEGHNRPLRWFLPRAINALFWFIRSSTEAVIESLIELIKNALLWVVAFWWIMTGASVTRC